MDPSKKSLYGLAFCEEGQDNVGFYALSANEDRQLWMRLREEGGEEERGDEDEEEFEESVSSTFLRPLMKSPVFLLLAVARGVLSELIVKELWQNFRYLVRNTRRP